MSQNRFDLEKMTRLIEDNPSILQFLKSFQGDFYGNPAIGNRVTVTSDGVADTEFSVTHGLVDADGVKRVPTGYIIIGKDKAGDVYNGATANTDTLLYLKCAVATVALEIWVF